jgi:hypothetical protein
MVDGIGGTGNQNREQTAPGGVLVQYEPTEAPVSHRSNHCDHSRSLMRTLAFVAQSG